MQRQSSRAQRSPRVQQAKWVWVVPTCMRVSRHGVHSCMCTCTSMRGVGVQAQQLHAGANMQAQQLHVTCGMRGRTCRRNSYMWGRLSSIRGQAQHVRQAWQPRTSGQGLASRGCHEIFSPRSLPPLLERRRKTMWVLMSTGYLDGYTVFKIYVSNEIIYS
jgi:hypothetical protein